MSLTISSFKTRCKASRRTPVSRDFLEGVVRRNFGPECSRGLNLLPDPQTRVIRMRRLAVHLRLTAAKLSAEVLTRLWVAEFLREFSRALSSGPGSKNEIVLAETRAEWLARFIADVLSGSASGRWEYEEFNEVVELSTADCVLMVFSREPAEIVRTLLALDERRRFEQLLLLFDELALEKLFSLLAVEIDEAASEPTIDDLLTISTLVVSQKRTQGRLASRQRALSIFVSLARTQELESHRVMTPRVVFHSLMTLDALVELTQSLPSESWFAALAPESLARRPGPMLHPAVLEVIAKLWAMAMQIDSAAQSQRVGYLFEHLLELSPVPIVNSSAAEKRAHWVSSEYAGLMLLVGLIDRLGWVQRIRISSLGQRLESRAINFCLAALALRLVKQSLVSDRLDPGLLLFAGWLEPASVDIAAFRNFLESLSEAEQVNLIDLLVDKDKKASSAASNWIGTFDQIAGVLIDEFASRVRGFRKSNREFVVQRFFSQPGRIFIDDKRILVVPQSNPFHIALHISSMDEPVESIGWLGGRRLEFQLEGL